MSECLRGISAFPGITIGGLSREDCDMFLYNFSQGFSQRFPTSDRIEDIYEALRFYYADWPYLEDPFKNRDMMARVCHLRKLDYRRVLHIVNKTNLN